MKSIKKIKGYAIFILILFVFVLWQFDLFDTIYTFVKNGVNKLLLESRVEFPLPPTDYNTSFNFPLPVGEDASLDFSFPQANIDVSKYSSTEEKNIPKKKYYYKKLNNKGKECYRKIVYGLQLMETGILLDTNDTELIKQTFLYVQFDYPEFFYVEKFSLKSGINGEKTVVLPIYSCNKAEKEKKQKVINKQVKKYLKGISSDASDYQKILYVFETIVNDVDYDLNSKDNQNIYSVFGNKKSVCAGYSRATQYLLEKLGVFATYVRGEADGVPHAWNLVKCSGKYYYLDTTWGDPIFLNTDNDIFSNYINYDFFCCSETEILKTHTFENLSLMPKCNSMKHNYYVVNGMYFDSYDKTEICNVLYRDFLNGRGSSIFKFKNKKDYQKAMNSLFPDLISKVWNQNTKGGRIEYHYINEDDTYKILIYWKYL